jgi:hypothetical protein
VNERRLPNLSRRGFLVGAAGLTAAAMLPSSSSSPVKAATTPLAGATIDPPTVYNTKNSVTAANIFDGYVGAPLALTIQKFYATDTILGQTTLNSHMSQLANAGCQFLVDVLPSKTLSTDEQTKLATWLAMLNNAGINYSVVLYSGNNNAFVSTEQWFTYWSYYAPVIKDAGVTCGYCPGCAYPISRTTEFFPSNPTPDTLWMDWYATAFRATSHLDPLIALAKQQGVTQMGMGEWGWSAGAPVLNPMIMPWYNEYGQYLIHLANTGVLNLGAIYFGGESGGVNNNIIGDAGDPRIPVIQEFSKAVVAAA